MTCTALLAPTIDLFINIDQGVWNNFDEAKGGKSVTYSMGTLSISGPNGAAPPISAPANHTVRHKFFGGQNFMAVCISETGVGPKSHSVSMVNFTTTPTSIVLLFTTPSDPNPPLPFLQYDKGPGSVCCIGGASGGQFYGLGIYRSDTGAILCPYGGGGYTPVGQVIGRAVAAGVQVQDGGTIIAGPCPLPAGALSVTPASATFGDVKLGGCPQPPSTKSFTLKNTGDDCLAITAIANVAPYSVSNVSLPLPQSLKPTESLTVTVTFAPAAVGTYNNVDLAITRAPANGANKITCSGKAVMAQAAFSVAPSSINFGHVLIGTSTAPHLVTIKNTGDVPISVSVAGATLGSPFQWTGFNGTLTCGQLQTLAVVFTPQTDGPAAQQVLTVTSTPGGTKTITLDGEGCVPNAKIVPQAAPFPIFGDVRQGYRMLRFITVHNTGDDTLTFTATISGPDAAMFGLLKPSMSIIDVVGSRPYSVNPIEHCGGGATGDGAEEIAVAFFANANPPKNATATLTIDSHNDGSAPASFPYTLSANVIAGNVVDVVAVFDTSGSMGDPIPGGGNKMQAAIQAGKLLVQLLPPDVHNRIGATRFSTDAATFLPIAEVTAAGQAGQTDAIKDPPLTPSGWTAIAAGAMTGIKEFATPNPSGPQPNLTKALIVVTDGLDNTAFKNPDDGLYYTLGGTNAKDPADPSVMVATNKFVPPVGVKVYAVGLGTGDDIDTVQLASLSSSAGGHFGAVDPTQPAVAYQLMKFYTQIYMDMVDTAVLKDPTDTILPGQKHLIEFDVLTGDVSATIVIYDFQGKRLPFWLESPKGEIVDAAFVPSGFQLRSGYTQTSRFLDVVLPWADPTRYAGRWKLVVMHDGQVCSGTPNPREFRDLGFRPRNCRKSNDPVDYGFMIGVGSNFRLQAYLSPGQVKIGEPIRLTGIPTEASLPVTGCAVTVDAISPIGQTWTGIVLKDDGAHDDGDPNDGEYARMFTQTAVPGAYTFTFRATGFTRDGEPVHREVVRSKMVEGKGSEPPPRRDDCCDRLVKLLHDNNGLLHSLLEMEQRSRGKGN